VHYFSVIECLSLNPCGFKVYPKIRKIFISVYLSATYMQIYSYYWINSCTCQAESM